jgi:hypothetical protein
VDIKQPFVEPGWVQFSEGKFMRSLALSSIQKMECCGPEEPPLWSWTNCSDVDVQVLLPP